MITIAQRLKTILGYDRFCVMEQGRIIEVGAPLELWEGEGVFRDMCDGHGIERSHLTNA